MTGAEAARPTSAGRPTPNVKGRLRRHSMAAASREPADAKAGTSTCRAAFDTRSRKMFGKTYAT